MEPQLEKLGLLSRFAHVACFGGALAGKPAPDLYLAACGALDVEPHTAIAIEDSQHGISAAKAAGLWCIAVPNAVTEGLDLSHADLRLRSLADTTLRDVLTRIADHPINRIRDLLPWSWASKTRPIDQAA